MGSQTSRKPKGLLKRKRNAGRTNKADKKLFRRQCKTAAQQAMR